MYILWHHSVFSTFEFTHIMEGKRYFYLKNVEKVEKTDEKRGEI